MTVYSHAIASTPSRTSRQPRSRWFWVSMIGLVALTVVIGGTLFVANRTVSERFTLERKKATLATLNAEVALQEADMANSVSMQNLVLFVERSGMVSEKSSDTLLIPAVVALGVPSLDTHETRP